MKIRRNQPKKGMVFRDRLNKKHYIVNVFIENGAEVVTYKYWMKRRQLWKFETEFKGLLLISFDYNLFVWEQVKRIVEDEG